MNATVDTLASLAHWAGRTSIEASLLILLIVAIQFLLGERLAPRWRSAIWLLLVARLALPWLPQSCFSAYNILPSSSLMARSQASPVNTFGGSSISVVVVPETGNALPEAMFTPPLLSGTTSPAVAGWGLVIPLMWLAGVIIVLGIAVTQSFAFAAAIRRQRFVTDQETLKLLEDCKQESGTHAYLAVVETEHVASPALFGVLRPRLLLPAGTLATLQPTQLRHIFLHELAHLRRHDVAVNWLMTILQAVHWFNPLVWYAFARMRADRELACDALALSRSHPEETHEYGRTFLYLLEKYAQPRRLPNLAGVLEKQNLMKRRISMIARFHKETSLRPALVGLLFLALGTVSLTGAQTSDDKQPSQAVVMDLPDVPNIDPPAAPAHDKATGMMGEKKPFSLTTHPKGELKGQYDENNQLVSMHAEREVVFSNEEVRILADEMTYIAQSSELVAKGKNVVVRQGDVIATGEQFKYLPTEHKGELTGNPILYNKTRDGKVSRTSGAKIVIQTANDRPQIMVFSGQASGKDPNARNNTEPIPQANDDRIVDNVDLPFVDDPALHGTWTSVDLVNEPGDFQPGRKSWGGDLSFKELVILPEGKTDKPWWTWTKGHILHVGDKTNSKYELKEMDGSTYMFFEWKSGDYTIRKQKPAYYVMKK